MRSAAATGRCGKMKKQKNCPGLKVVLSDISEGMLSDAEKNIEQVKGPDFSFQRFDCQNIPFSDKSFDRVIANHVLFYVGSLQKALEEIHRVMKDDGIFYCSAYGKEHMKEVTMLVQEFDPRISLSEVNLFDMFGLEGGEAVLKRYFADVKKIEYEDALIVTEAEPLLDYILSCHGNQNEILNDRQMEFKEFLKKKIDTRQCKNYETVWCICTKKAK